MKTKKEKPEKITRGFKGFDKNFQCRGFQFKEGETYEEPGDPVRCEKGFHFCENPLDVFGYYPPADSRYSEVDGIGKTSTDDSDSKVAVTKIKIGAEIGLQQLIESGIKFIFEKTTLTKETTNKENNKHASNSGDRGAASNSGYSGAASNSGDRGAASNSGYSGAASNSGYRGAASNSGYRGAASNSGDRGAALSIGSYSTAETLKENSFACGLGYGNKARGEIGSWLVLAEYNEEYKIIAVKTAKVDGKKIQANVWYVLKDNKFVTAE